MDSYTRQNRILDLARTRGRVEVGPLADELGVAAETIRRDLKSLAHSGVVKRVHGGAVALESAGFETGLARRSTENLEEKRRIAAAAANLLHGAETVYLDEGFSPQLIAEHLFTRESLTVVTASLLVANVLAESPGVTVLLVGGRLRGRTLATVDHWALRSLGELVIDVAFLGTNGITREHGLTTPDPAVAAVKRAAVSAARRSILVAANTKFGLTSFCRFADVTDFEVIVTDTGLASHEAHRYEALGPHVLRV